MIISMIVAMDLDRGIGYRGKIPWHLPSDLRRFKRLTMGHHILMGRKTFDSIGRLLPGRISIVLSRSPKSLPDGFQRATTLKKGLAAAEKGHETEFFIIGGEEVFTQALSITDRIYLTTVQARFECDVHFPELEEAKWRVAHQEDLPESGTDPFESQYRILERINQAFIG